MAYNLAVLVVSIVSLHGMKMEAFENVSVMVSMVSYVSDKGSLTIKSMAIDVNGLEYTSDDRGKRGGFALLG